MVVLEGKKAVGCIVVTVCKFVVTVWCVYFYGGL